MASDPWGFVLFIVPTVVRSKFKPNLTINMFDENSTQIVKKMEMNSLNELWSPEKTNHHCKMRKSTKILYPRVKSEHVFCPWCFRTSTQRVCGVTVCSLLDRKNQLIHLSDVLRSNLGGKNLGFMVMKWCYDILSLATNQPVMLISRRHFSLSL